MKARPQKLLPKGMTGGRATMKQPRQHESLFSSEEEKQAQIERYKEAESEFATLEVTAQERLASIKAD